VARDQAEGVRLAYVAATRARDLLVVPAVGDEPWDGGWFAPLNRALYPPVASRRQAARGPKCPAFKSKDTVLQRPHDEAAGPATVCPGQHAFSEEGGYHVVWWDPRALELDAAPPFGVRRGDLVVRDVPTDVVADGRSNYDRWKLARHEARAAGAVPSLAVTTVGEIAALDADAAVRSRGVPTYAPSQPPGAADIDVTIVDLTVAGEEVPGGAAFGTLVHAILAQAPFDASPGLLRDIAAAEAMVLGLGDRAAAAAAARAGRVFAHDLLKRAHRAAGRGACRRETPITLTLDDGRVVEGIVDLAFEDDDGRWVTVDYKTDRELSAAEDQYRRQVKIYASAVAAATARPAVAVLVRA
jgi:ATP-dependent exoDNAse (exonuclease V) beta subunit